ncbi:cytochrome P450 [Lentzea tibetensis]|uniref:Cytochrome P450 n=1 Tax=Lentzea tibetensis TaxID=2591470 RepID=A0A563EUF4_9PSEU|nr:cytochrome P450 [Lentzea tibetensis]TWP50764.1 cytochrome P450 [Lentzea tibetensis]
MTTQLPALDIGTPAHPAPDPQELFRQLLTDTPVTWVPALQAHLLVRRADVASALRDSAFAPTSLTQNLKALTEEQQERLRPVYDSITLWVGHTVPEDHKRFQLLLKRYFTPRTVEGLRPRINQIANELIDRADGGMEVVADLAYPLPAIVIAEMLGMPLDQREQLQRWSKHITALFAISTFDELLAAQQAVLEMQDYMLTLLEQRRAEPTDDLLSMFAAAERDGLVSEAEIVANCVLLLFAGHETTARLIGNGLSLLFANPEEFERLKADPALMPSAVEEMMRVAGPASIIPRVTARQVEIAGQVFPEGTSFYLALGAANRDPEVYTDPDRFDVARGNAGQQIGFGMGTYYCLGAALARVEASECFRVLLERVPGLALAEPEERAIRFPLTEDLVALRVKF